MHEACWCFLVHCNNFCSIFNAYSYFIMASSNLGNLRLLGSITNHLIITLLILGYLSVGLRLWARCRVTKSPGWDDVAMVATLLLFTTYCAFILAIHLRVKDDKFFTQKSIQTTLTVRRCMIASHGEVFHCQSIH